MKKMKGKKVLTSISMKDSNKMMSNIPQWSKMHGCLNFLLATIRVNLECEQSLSNPHQCLFCIFPIRWDNPKLLGSSKKLAHPFLRAVMSNWSNHQFPGSSKTLAHPFLRAVMSNWSNHQFPGSSKTLAPPFLRAVMSNWSNHQFSGSSKTLAHPFLRAVMSNWSNHQFPG